MIDYGAVKQRVAEFDAKHGTNIFHDDRILFADGACREANPLGLLREPPSDPYELAKRKLWFYELCLKRATETFQERKTHFVRGANANLRQRFCGPPPGDAEQVAAELEELRQAVLTCQKKREDALAEVKEHTPARLKERAEQDEVNRRQNQELVGRLFKIEV